MLAYIKNMHDQILEPEYKGVFAYCPKCGSQCSANKGDYFMADKNTPLKCCGKIMKLVRKEVRYIPA